LATPHNLVDVNDAASCDEATAWWTALTSSDGKGSQVDPSWYSDALVEDSFGEPTVEDRLTQPDLDKVSSGSGKHQKAPAGVHLSSLISNISRTLPKDFLYLFPLEVNDETMARCLPRMVSRERG
jgi:hypothetical protein